MELGVYLYSVHILEAKTGWAHSWCMCSLACYVNQAHLLIYFEVSGCHVCSWLCTPYRCTLSSMQHINHSLHTETLHTTLSGHVHISNYIKVAGSLSAYTWWWSWVAQHTTWWPLHIVAHNNAHPVCVHLVAAAHHFGLLVTAHQDIQYNQNLDSFGL